MKLSTLIQYLPGARTRMFPRGRAAATHDVCGVTPNLREVRPGMAYFALPEDSEANPHAAHTAYQRGASLVVCGPDLALPARAPAIRVADPHAALATAAAAFREFPANRLRLLAVTGDEAGRRGVAHIVANILGLLGIPTGLLTQNGFDVGGRHGSTGLNQLDAAELQALLRQQVNAGGGCVVTEFDSAEFPEGLNGLQFARQIIVSPPAIFRHTCPLLLNPRGSRTEIRAFSPAQAATTPLIGRRSLLALDRSWEDVVAVAESFGHTSAAVGNTLPVLSPVPGWLEPVQCGQPFGVFVDGATNAVALTAALRDARELTRGRLHVVCGARATASDTDNAALGNAALALADHVHVTSDNPHRRPFQELVVALIGSETSPRTTLQSDRAAAIRGAIRSARAGDVVVIAGKADAPVQELGHVIIPFDDRVVATQVLNSRGYVGGGE